MGKLSSGRLMSAGILDILLYGTTASMLGTLLPNLSAQYHLSPKQNGEIASLQALGLMIASIAAGPLIDNKGKKTGFLVGLSLMIVSLLGLPQARGWGMIAACMFLLGLGGGTVVTGANTLVSDVGA